ncbi:MAG: hypothetical protein H6622_15870 [Halobacteriovoraceae bacterium]|nr:hypothetical protein [Halobacteriovoraceae bacterium]
MTKKSHGKSRDEKDSPDDKESIFSDVIKRVVSIGVGAAFMTEDAVRNLIGDIPLPKDIVNGLIQNAKDAKDDFAKSVKDEVRKYLSEMDSKKLIEHIVDNYDFELNATIKLKKKKDAKDDQSA